MRTREQRARRTAESRAAETRLRCLIDPVAADPPAARIRSSPLSPVSVPPGPPPSFGAPESIERSEPFGVGPGDVVESFGRSERFGVSESFQEPEPFAEPQRLRVPEAVGEPEPFGGRLGSRFAEISGRVRSGGLKVGDRMPLLDPGGPGLRVLVLVGVLAAAVAGFVVWRTRPVAEPVAPPVPMSAGLNVGAANAGPENAETASSGVGSAGAGSPSPTSSLIVYVTGKVRKPGVLELPPGSRVVDAVKAAGGVKKGANPGGVNLARKLVDGEQITVGADAAAGEGSQPAGQPDGGGVVNLNNAGAEQLKALPGVGDVLAQRIIDFRDAHGGFSSVDQLRQVSGIGEKKFAELRDKVVV